MNTTTATQIETRPTRRSLRLDMVFTLEAPLHHGAGSDGNLAVLRREKALVRGPNGERRVQQLPLLSGNSLKHTVIRDPGVRHMCRVLGIESLTRPAIHLLFSGGSLSTKGSAINAMAYTELADLIPIVGVCGGAIGNSMRASKIVVQDALPICDEYREHIPLAELASDRGPDYPPLLEPGAEDFRMAHLTQVRMLTRHDPLREPDVRALLTAAEAAKDDEQKSLALADREQGKHVDKGDSQQMIAFHETIIRGAELYWPVYTRNLLPREEAALWAAIGAWRLHPFLGAGKARGLGRASLRIRSSEPILVPDAALLPVDVHPDAAGAMSAIVEYEDHLRTNRKRILEVLGEVA